MNNEILLHNSQESVFREPFGAVEVGTEVFLRIKTESIEIESIELRIWNGAGEVIVPMLKNNDYYECKFISSEKPRNIWYYFIVHFYGGLVKFYGNNERGLGGVGKLYDHEPPSYQITVYDKNLDVPDWYSKTITYQIFVDRFYNSGIKKYYDRHQIFHNSWNEIPIKNNLNNDFYGGDLQGIIEKLPYLKSLNVGTIYLNPIFQSTSNHKYNTKDYKKIDEHFGDEKTFRELCKKAKECDIKIILDGVFNHVGSDSEFFQKAVRDKNSPYFDWFDFEEYPDKYASWWGIRTMPTLNKDSESLKDYLFRDNDSVIKKWLKLGASGWRLDVVDELPQKFVELLHDSARQAKKDAVIIGEVWEDASNKVSYSVPRRYFLGKELDGVMNYPLKNSLINFIMGYIPAEEFSNIFESLKENYPKKALYSCMNILGGHDIVRPKTIFGEAPLTGLSNEQKAGFALSPIMADLSRKRMKLASLIQMTFPGSPCIYYGDEAGLEGYEDPFNRRGFPWNNFDMELFDWYKSLGKKRAGALSLQMGEHKVVYAYGSVYAFARIVRKGEKDAFGEVFNKTESYLIAVNVSGDTQSKITVDLSKIGGKPGQDGEILLGPLEGKVIKIT